MRGRNRNNKGPNPLTRTYESNGPDVKIRGTAQHIAEKYSQLARDAQASGDPVSAENYLQHAEHYFRIIAAAQEQLREQYGYQDRFQDEGDEEGGFDTPRFPGANGDDVDPGSQPQPYEKPEGERGDRQPRFDRNDRQDRQDRRERFQRDRGPRQDMPRQDMRQDGNREERGERSDQPRGERDFRRDRRPRQDEVESEAGGLPAFLTNPVRQPIAVSGDEGEAPAEGGLNGAPVNGNGEGDYRRSRRRRRSRFSGDEAGAEGGDFSPEGVEPPAAE